MLKILTGSLLVSLFFSSSSFAENCIISDALKGKSCSTEYFRAKNEKELGDYLLNGKFKDGKLLNLDVGFNIKEKEINIATSCDLKISKERRLFAKQNGICLKGSSVHLEGENELVADKSASIDISATNSVIVRRSSLETKGDLSISTSNFLPFNGEVLISRESLLKARNIHINSKSNLIINSESKLKAANIILDGGNCEINEKNDRDNDDERDHAKECRKFKPSFAYTGTCTSNPLPTNMKITSSANSTNSQSVSFSVLGAPTTSHVNWMFDQAFGSIDTIAKQDFIYPGKHLAQAVIISSSGYFRKVGQYLNVSPVKFNKSQIAIFQFVGSKNAPNKIQAAIDMRNITLKKSPQDPELYFTEITGDQAGIKNILIPYFNYQGKFSLNILPVISNPDEYVNNQFNQINTAIDTLTSDLQYGNLAYGLKLIVAEAQSKFSSLTSDKKLQTAQMIQANLSQGMLGTTTLNKIKNKNKKFNFSDIIMPTAEAFLVPPDTTLQDKITLAYAFRYLAYAMAGIGLGVDVMDSGIILLPEAPVFGVISIAAGVTLIIQTIKAEQALLRRIFAPARNFILSLNPFSDAYSSETNFVQFKGNFESVPTGTSSSEVQLIIQQTNNTNLIVSKINGYIVSANQFLASLAFKNAIPEQVSPLVYPANQFSSYLSNQYVKATLLSSDFNDVTLTTTAQDEVNLGLILKAPQTENAVIRFRYYNPILGIDTFVDQKVTVLVPPKAVINYTKNNLAVNFDSTDSQNPNVTGLNYSWNFGDGHMANTNSKTFSHTYSVAGTYNVSLTVIDSYGASDIAQASVIVTAGGASVTFCNIGNLTNSMDFSLSSGDSFSLSHYQPTYQEYYVQGLRFPCECKTLNLQQNATYNLSVGGTLPDIGAMVPYIGSITIQNQQEVFSTSYRINSSGMEEFIVYRGAAFGNGCESYISK